MEATEPTHSIPPARDQSAPAPGVLGGLGGQASPRLTLGRVTLPPEQGLPRTVFLKALPVPLYHTVSPGGLQPHAPRVAGSLEGAGVPFILSPLLQPDAPSPTQMGKPATPALTVNIVGTLPVLSPGVGSTLVSTGRVKNAGKYLCPHCGRDCLKPSVLEKHIRSHTGERPFPCTTCGIAFKTQSNLYKHRRTQTHLNNSRLSLESEGGGSSLLEEGDRPGETASVDSRGDEGTPENPLSPGTHATLAARNRETPEDQAHTTSPEFPLASPQPRRKVPEPKPPSLQRQQETCSEKPWDSKALEGPLRKCESTDSGYLSRSDSVEQPPAASSPLHSLSEHSAESEGEGGPGCGSAGNKAEQGTPGASLELEKKRLEERIAQLISHNQAVVDDPQLDHVRPRKTVLSKQGSIDLPMPYTYKDSFQFDIRALDPSRRRAALSPAHSTFTPLQKTRPLFFHSVPTQLSTTVECVPVTRSNSLPFIEGSKLWPEPRDPQDAFPSIQKALSPRLTPARLGDCPGLTLTSIPSGHPRALVRQAAVEDLPCTPTGDPSAIAEDLDGKRAAVKDGALCKGRASKRYGQKKQKMFSQEKWQVYGNETFKRIYQKMKTNQQEGQKLREVKQSQGLELDLPPQEEVVGTAGEGLSQDNKIPILGDTAAGAKLGSWGNRASLEDSSEFPKQLKAVARAKSSPTLGSTETLCLSSKSPLLPPRRKSDLGCQLPPEPAPVQGKDLEAPELALPDSSHEVINDTCPGDQTVLRQPSGMSEGPQPAEDKLPLERKRLKMERLGHPEQPRPLEAETPGCSVRAVSQLAQKQDSNSEEVVSSSNDIIQHVTVALESCGASSAVSAIVLRWPGLGDKDPTLPSVPRTPELHSLLLPAQPRDPGVPDAVSGGSYAPRYLLRLPQGETPSTHVAPGPGKGRDSLCTRAPPGEQLLLAGSELGMLQPPGEAGGPPEDPSCSKPKDGREEAQMGRQKQDRTNSSAPMAEHCPDPNTGTTQETASVPPAHPCGSHMTRDAVGEDRAPHGLCTDSAPTRARTYGNLLNPWTSSRKLGTPKIALEGPASETEEGLPACFPSQAHYLLTPFTRPQGSVGPQKLALSCHVGPPRSSEAPSSFPSLKAEPQLTWCCLSCSLPLPAEQQRAAPGRLASYAPDRSLQAAPKSSGGKARTSHGGRGGAGTAKAPEEVSLSAGEHNDCFPEKEHANGPGLSLQANAYLAGFQEGPLPQSKGFGVGPPGTLLPPSQDPVSTVPNPCISPGVSEPPPSFRSKGTFPHHDIATSVAATCVSAGTQTEHKTLGIHSAEETRSQGSPDRRAIPESIAQTLLPARPSPGKRSPGKKHLEILQSDLSPTASHQEEMRPQTDFPSWGQYSHGEVAVQCAPSGSESRTCHNEGLINPTSVMAPSDQGDTEVSEAPLRSIRKRSLEGTRKQIRVEFSDTSSDDEDRLVIEM
ncbi:Zfp831 [Phodopus roborovskii]|uniref:Zfp831 protein n=1 Tax=Phodopus roborovskii TaxID=109678 RepID=A0AAU9YPF3_PHORO|nr:Zfp831 [Phodopus roborovskii]